MSNSSERKYLTFEEAEAMLPKAERIHTLRQGPIGVWWGADWDRSKILDVFKKFKPELAGPVATNIKHGIVLIDDRGSLFIETI